MLLNLELFPDLTKEDFLYFKKVLHDLTGISLSESKRELVKSRIRSHIQDLGFQTYSEYRRHLTKISNDNHEWQKFVNLFTTNKTDFFREIKHFDFIESNLVSHWQSEKIKDVKIWCCAASTGQEPYSLSMVLAKSLPLSVNFKILATDIDTDVLQKSRNGVYPIAKLSEIPKDYQDNYVNIGKGDVRSWFRISDSIRNHIDFKQHNLIDSTYPGSEIFDVIFCRNVLIYFTPDTIKTLMKKLHLSLKKNGILFISHSEAIPYCSDLFRLIQPSIYKKV